MSADNRRGAPTEVEAPLGKTDRKPPRSRSSVAVMRDRGRRATPAHLFDLDAEIAALGYIVQELVAGSGDRAVLGQLKAWQLTDRRRAILEGIHELVERGEAPTLRGIADAAQVDLADLLELQAGAALGVTGFEAAARALQELATRRQMLEAGGMIAGMAEDAASSLAEVLDFARGFFTDSELAPATEPPARTVAEVMAELAGKPAPRFLVSGLIAAGDYGVLGAERKAGKTFAALDLAVAVASGGKWLGQYPVDEPGPVLFSGPEGGPRKFVRRLRAIAGFYGVDLGSLPLYLEFRSRDLTDSGGLAAFEREIQRVKPVLVIVDSFYRTAPADNIKDLSARGAILQRLQEAVTESSEAALLVTHHFNKTGVGAGPDRLSGTAFAEWARIIVSLSQVGTPRPGGDAILELAFDGDEIPHSSQRFLRKVSVDDPADLASAMHYEIRAAAAFDDFANPDLPPAQRSVLAILRQRGEDWSTRSEIQDATASSGFPLKDRTVQNALKELESLGLARSQGTLGASGLRWQATACAFDAHSEDARAQDEF